MSQSNVKKKKQFIGILPLRHVLNRDGQGILAFVISIPI